MPKAIWTKNFMIKFDTCAIISLALLAGAVFTDGSSIERRHRKNFSLRRSEHVARNSSEYDQGTLGVRADSNHTFLSGLVARAGSNVPVYTSCNKPGSFSLTFDDGPSQFSAKLDSTLDASNLRASFFINGNNFGCIYDFAELLLQRFKKGDLIASHTWSHVHLSQGNYQQISYQLELLENAMVKILGVKPLYFRPPYGEYNDLVLQVLGDRGYKGLILWDQDTQDSSASPPDAAQIIKSYQNYPEKTNVLNHETSSLTVDQVMPSVIPDLKSKGYNYLTSPDCLDLGSNPNDWYSFVHEPAGRDSSWTCDGTPGSEIWGI